MAAEGITAEPLGYAALQERFPVLSDQHVAGGLFFPDDGHLDVHELHTGYLGHARRSGAELRCSAEVTGLIVEGGRCVGVQTEAHGPLRTRWVVNAAGAWVGELGRAAGAAPIPFSPLRRTAITFAPPEELRRESKGWPLVEHEHQGLYFKPESGGLLASPMDETPSPPCDARPTEEDVALCAERLSRIAPPLRPRSISRKWAGLRTFSPDRVPVVGEDPLVPGFFWLAGQGGMGIESSPALGEIAAELLLDGQTGRFDARLLSPARFG
jgi:D-arginine dehydrogenase